MNLFSVVHNPCEWYNPGHSPRLQGGKGADSQQVPRLRKDAHLAEFGQAAAA